MEAELSQNLQQDQAAAANALSRLPVTTLSGELFHQFCRLVVMPAVEVVPIHVSDSGELHILLIPRQETDPVWPGQLHTPGTILRSLDRKGSFDDAFSRILKGELAGIRTLSAPQFVGTLFIDSERGGVLQLIHWVEIDSNGPFSLFPVTSLPERLIQAQRPMIEMAVQNFKEVKGLDNNSLEGTQLPQRPSE